MSQPSSRHIAFLRALNTTGRRAKNTALIAAAESAGAQRAVAFLASGNVVVDWPAGETDEIEVRLEESFRNDLGFEVPTIVRSGDEVTAAAVADPFPGVGDPQTMALFVGFLKDAPRPDVMSELKRHATEVDRLALVESNIFWLSIDGEFGSQMSVPALERSIGTMTIRSINTVRRLADRFL